MKCKTLAVTVLTAILFISTLSVIQAVKAFSDQPIISTSGAFTLYSPLNVTYNSIPITLSVGFESFMGIPYVLSYYIDGKYQGDIPYTVQRSNETHIEYPATGSLDLPALSAGSHSLTVNMNGVRNTTYTATVCFTVTAARNAVDMNPSPALDSEMPSQFEAFTVYSPANITYNTRFLTLNLTFECFHMKYLLSYDIDGKHIGDVPYTVKYDGELHIGYPAAASVDLPPLSDGTHSVTVHMYATELKTRNPYYDGRVYFTVDPDGKLTPQSISNLSIQAATYNMSDLPLEFTTNKNIAMAAFSLDGEANVTINENTTLTDLTEGVHNLTLYVQDQWGNAANQTVNFTIDLPKPLATEQPEFSSPSPIGLGLAATLAVALTGCLLYHKKKSQATLKRQQG